MLEHQRQGYIVLHACSIARQSRGCYFLCVWWRENDDGQTTTSTTTTAKTTRDSDDTLATETELKRGANRLHRLCGVSSVGLWVKRPVVYVLYTRIRMFYIEVERERVKPQFTDALYFCIYMYKKRSYVAHIIHIGHKHTNTTPLTIELAP